MNSNIGITSFTILILQMKLLPTRNRQFKIQ